MSSLITWLEVSKHADLDQLGGKAANLVELVSAGFPVPPGFIVTTEAYRIFVQANQLQPRILALAPPLPSDNAAASSNAVFENAAATISASFNAGTLPDEIATAVKSAYHALSHANQPRPGPADVEPEDVLPVAVRSSATAEDLPGLAFAGQQDTYLNILGDDALLDAIKNCWGSLWTARAMAYRARNHIPPDGVALAVVVQKMIASDVSGVLFTANPVTGRRDETIIDASFGLGEAIVSGQVDPDHYVLSPRTWNIAARKVGSKEISIVPRPGGGTYPVPGEGASRQALPDTQIVALAQIAERVADHFGSPQDIEWAWANGALYLLQARPITSLYPLPENPNPAQGLRVYINFNSIQGVTDPLTPLGIDALRLVFAGIPNMLHLHSSMRDILPEAGARLFLDFTALVRDPSLQKAVLGFLAQTDPGARQILLRLIQEGRIPAKRALTPRLAFTLLIAALPTLRRVLAALLKPEQVRPRALAAAEQFIARAREHARAAPDLDACLRAMENDLSGAEEISLGTMPTVLPAFAAIPLVDRWLSRWLGEKPGAALHLMRGLPGNLTIEMDLQLWAAAQAIRADPGALERIRGRSVEELVKQYRRAEWPPTAQRALDAFLKAYGMRGVAEIDLGRPRWRDNPTPVVQTLLGYLQLQDPQLAPDVVFQHAAEQAERLTADYVARVRRTRFGWLRAKLLAATIRRMRILGGLREAPLFFLVRVNDIYRTALRDAAGALVTQGQLECAEDVYFVPLETLKRFTRGERMDLHTVVAAQRARYAQEAARRQMPRLLLSTGEAFYEGLDSTATGNELVGDAVSPGVAEGRARVILDPHGAHLEPGEILVCPSTDPGWTPLFLTAAGLVMEIGGLITHGSVVAREYGIPAVVGVHNATKRLLTGQRVRVDGNRGRVALLE